MKIICSDQPIQDLLDLSHHSIFLVGPTPRSRAVKSWRPDAIEILKELNYDGQVIVPERSVPADHVDYDAQVEWEHFGLDYCINIAAWIPRDLVTMPAFTTNVEFGMYVDSSKLLYGRPDDAPKNRYLDWVYKKFNPTRLIHNNLKDLMIHSTGL